MKKILVGALAVIFTTCLALTVCGCSSNSSKASSPVGIWKVDTQRTGENEDHSWSSGDSYMCYIFNEDGTAEMVVNVSGLNSAPIEGTWSNNEGDILFKIFQAEYIVDIDKDMTLLSTDGNVEMHAHEISQDEFNSLSK